MGFSINLVFAKVSVYFDNAAFDFQVGIKLYEVHYRLLKIIEYRSQTMSPRRKSNSLTLDILQTQNFVFFYGLSSGRNKMV